MKDIFGRFGWSIDFPTLDLRGAEPGCLFRDVPGDALYSVDPVARILLVYGSSSLDPDTLQHCLLDLVLPRLLASGDMLTLHGALILHDGYGFGLLAASGRGKSTLGASFHGKDTRVLGDDALVLQPSGTGYQAQCLYPSLRLFPDSLAEVLPGRTETTPVAGYTRKRRVRFDAAAESAPLCVLFRLTDPGDDIHVTRLVPAAACMAIIENAFALDPENVQEAKRRFAMASRVAQVIPVFDLTYPRDYARLPEVHAAIFAALNTLPDLPNPETTRM